MKNQKGFNVVIAPAIQDEFTTHIEERGYTKYRALEAAIKAFMAQLPDIQVRLMAPSVSTQEAGELIRNAAVQSEIQDMLAKMTPDQRTQILLTAKSAAEKVVSPKKK